MDKTCCEKMVTWPATRKWQDNGERRRKRAGIILTHETTGKVLLVQNFGNKWSFPKGGIESGETAREAARRELREETGISLEESEEEDSIMQLRDQIYFCHTTAREPDYSLVKDKQEITGFAWMCSRCYSEFSVQHAVRRYFEWIRGPLP